MQAVAGEARIWYLDRAGWLVRTSEHLLVFDYTNPVEEGALSVYTLKTLAPRGDSIIDCYRTLPAATEGSYK